MTVDPDEPASAQVTQSPEDPETTRQDIDLLIDRGHAAMAERSRVRFGKHLPPGFGRRLGQEAVDSLNSQFHPQRVTHPVAPTKDGEP